MGIQREFCRSSEAPTPIERDLRLYTDMKSGSCTASRLMTYVSSVDVILTCDGSEDLTDVRAEKLCGVSTGKYG